MPRGQISLLRLDSDGSLRVSARGKAVPTTKDYGIGIRLARAAY